MIDALAKVFGAVSDKTLIPALAHLLLYPSRMQAFNGQLCIDTTARHKLECLVPASLFKAAIEQAPGARMHLDEMALHIVKGPFRAVLPTLPIEQFPRMRQTASAQSVALPDAFIERLKLLTPFIGVDMTRPWACSVALRGAYAYATNNVTLVRVKLGSVSPLDVDLPGFLVHELVRLAERPAAIICLDRAVEFHYSDSTWVHARLYEQRWPQSALDLIEANCRTATFVKLSDKLRAAVESVAPFCPDPMFRIIVLDETSVKTRAGTTGASVTDFKKLPAGQYRYEVLKLVFEHAQEIALSAYPNPVPFKGEHMEGVFIGVRQ